jgi:glycosyltransferase involved in cell wall biosynthesis
MTVEEYADLLLAFARMLLVNGQSTDQTLAAAERIGQTLGLHAEVIPRWDNFRFGTATRHQFSL